MPRRDNDMVHVLFVRPLVYGKMMVEAAYGHGHCVVLVVLVAVGHREDAVDVVSAEPRLHDNLCRANLMHLVIRATKVVVEPWLGRSEEHTSELQSPMYLVCRLLLEKKKEQVLADVRD